MADAKADPPAADPKHAAGKLAASAEQLSSSAVQLEGSADRRVVLAADRTIYAAERTYAAWVRTGLAALASGVGARKLLEGLVPGWAVALFSALLVAFAAFSFAAAVWRQVAPGLPPMVEGNAPQLPPLLLAAINGVLVLVALGVLAGLLFGASGG